MPWVMVPPGWERRRQEIVDSHISNQEINTLAIYNAERARGLAHTSEWDARMADLQDRFDRAMAETSEAFSAATRSNGSDGG